MLTKMEKNRQEIEGLLGAFCVKIVSNYSCVLFLPATGFQAAALLRISFLGWTELMAFGLCSPFS